MANTKWWALIADPQDNSAYGYYQIEAASQFMAQTKCEQISGVKRERLRDWVVSAVSPNARVNFLVGGGSLNVFPRTDEN